jgi:hypothetical protein
MIKSRKMRSEKHVTDMEETRDAYKIFVGKIEVRKHSGNLSSGGSVIPQWILKRQAVKLWF